MDLRGSSSKGIYPIPKGNKNYILGPWPLNPVKLSRKWPDLTDISILASFEA